MSKVQTELNDIVKEIRFLAKECDARIKCVVTMENIEYKCIAEADNGGLHLSIAGYGTSMETALLSAAKHLKVLMVQMMVENDLLAKVFAEDNDDEKEKTK
jgi:hypothetical protein